MILQLLVRKCRTIFLDIIVNVLAKINKNKYCNIEMQVAYKSNMIKRMLYYWARQYAKNIKKSEKYSELKRTIGVLIANFEIEELKGKGFHSKWKIKDNDEGIGKTVLTDDLEFHIIELPKLHQIIIQKMKQAGIKVEKIAKITGISKEEIEKI